MMNEKNTKKYKKRKSKLIMTHIHYRRPCVRYSVRPSVHRMLLPVLRLNDKAMVDIRLRPAGAAAW